MIPKRIFYVWLGGKKTNLANACIESWYQLLPDWEIIEINENTRDYFNFEEELVNNLWFKTLVDLKIYAFAAEYIRCKTLFVHGGIYLDSDVTLYKDLTPFLQCNLFLYGSPATDKLDAAVLGSVKGHEVLDDMLHFYTNDVWKSSKYIIPDIITDVVYSRYGLSASKSNIVENNEITIYPYRYFCPHYYSETFTHDHMTSDTCTVHWHAGSWMNKRALYFLSQKHRVPLSTLVKQVEFISRADRNAYEQIDPLQALAKTK
jgi:mannosyltransferase OCH1-like enzyme